MHKLSDKIKTTDGNGNEVVVFEYTEYFSTPNFQKPNDETKGFKSYELADGSKVNVLSGGEFEVVLTDQKLKIK